MPQIILFNKPFNVLSQFTDEQGRETLADYLQAPGFRPAGRLDYDSEGLLVLTDDGQLQQQIANPSHRQWKRYLVQVEGEISPAAIARLSAGVELKDGLTLPSTAEAIAAPDIWPRHPPIRVRKTVPDSWLALTIREGRNRQVRRMTAAVGFPTLRLIRASVGNWSVDGLAPGQHRIERVAAGAKKSAARPSRNRHRRR